MIKESVEIRRTKMDAKIWVNPNMVLKFDKTSQLPR